MSAQRGTVRRIEFEVEYPDGTRKVRVFDGSDGVDVGAIHAIVLNDSFIREDDASNFTVSDDDWTKNPTMGVYFAPPNRPDIQCYWACTPSSGAC